MKLSVTQENLNKALGYAIRIVSSRNSLPILGNVLLATDASRLKISATNLEMAISCTIGCKAEVDGAISVPARLLTDVVSSMPNDKLALISSGDNLMIKTTNFDSQINGINADEFPAIPEVKATQSISISAGKLIERLNLVVFAASPDESRPVLAGVVFIIEGDKLTLVATDSYRLAETQLAVKKSKDAKVIVPARTINELIRVIGDYEGDIELKFSSTEAVFEVGDISIVSRLIDGKFPDYKQIIPSQSKTEVVAQRADLLNIVKVASIFARENANTIKMKFDANSISIASSATSVGENSSSIDVQINGAPGEISLNARYLIDVLSAIKSEQVLIGINDKLDPCRIRPQQKNEAIEYTHIIMPLRS